MNDLHRGYDLTSVVENVARNHYEASRAEILARYEEIGAPAERRKDVPPWEEVDPHGRYEIKERMLPLVELVIDALEEHQPSRVAMRPYGWQDAADRDDPRFYENQPAQRDPDTATVWVLHLNPPNFMVNVIIERMSTYPEVVTGDFVLGDSWQTWGERPPVDEEDVHLGIYYRVNDRKDAQRIGQFLYQVACFAAGVDDMNMAVLWAVDDR